MPSSTWSNLSHEKQQRVVRAAATEFAAHGFSSGSLNVIARDADVAKGSLFQYFDDKIDLFHYVYAQLAAGTRAAMEKRIDQAMVEEESIFGVVRRILVEFIEFHRENPLEGAILRAMTFEPDAEVRAKLREEVDSHYVDLIGAVVGMAEANGQLRAGISTDTLKTFVHGLFSQLGLAGISPELNPFVPLHELEGEDLEAAIAEFIAPIEAYYSASSHTVASTS